MIREEQPKGRRGFDSLHHHQPIFKDMEQERKSIVPSLRAMEVGAKEMFPLEQLRSIGNTIHGANLAIERANGMKWSLKTDLANRNVIVTRVS